MLPLIFAASPRSPSAVSAHVVPPIRIGCWASRHRLQTSSLPLQPNPVQKNWCCWSRDTAGTTHTEPRQSREDRICPTCEPPLEHLPSGRHRDWWPMGNDVQWRHNSPHRSPKSNATMVGQSTDVPQGRPLPPQRKRTAKCTDVHSPSLANVWWLVANGRVPQTVCHRPRPRAVPIWGARTVKTKNHSSSDLESRCGARSCPIEIHRHSSTFGVGMVEPDLVRT